MNAKIYAAPDGALFLILMKLQLCRAYGAKSKVMETFFRLIKIALPLAIMSICLFGYVLHSQSEIFREFEAALQSVEWMLLACITIWCGGFIFLTFSRNDLPLIGLLLIAIAAYFIGYVASWRVADAIILLAGVTLGRGARFFLSGSSRRESALTETPEINQSGLTSAATFLIGVVLLLAFASWWHLDMAGAYHGPRWMGLWDNPNDYGMLMGAGVVLAIGLRASPKSKVQSPKSLPVASADCADGRRLFSFFHLRKSAESADKNISGTAREDARPTGKIRDARNLSLQIILFIAVFMMAVGLICSYSRGAWVGAAVGLLYLAQAHGKFKWRYVMAGFGLVALGILLFWGRTPDSSPWYLKRGI